MNAIAITGIGVAIPLGHGRGEVLARLRGGTSALAWRRFATGLECPYGCVEDLPREWERVLEQGCPPGECEALKADTVFACGVACADRALAQAGLDPGAVAPERVAVIAGSSKGQVPSLVRAAECWRCRHDNPAGAARVGPALMASMGCAVSSLIARTHGFAGPALNYPAACATGLQAIIAGAELVAAGAVDVALAGAVEPRSTELLLHGFHNLGALSADFMRPFDRRRNGFNAGEGGAIFVLEQEDAARRRGATPVALLRGWDFRSDAHHMTAIEPEGTVIEHSVRRSIRMAGWHPESVDLVNAHGTATQLNDRVEDLVIGRVFPPATPVTALKSWMGHLLGASSSAELAISIWAAQDGLLPAIPFHEETDAAFRINLQPQGGAMPPPRRIVKLAYGFGCQVATGAVEVCPPPNEDTRSTGRPAPQ